jgi:hypothetical protein
MSKGIKKISFLLLVFSTLTLISITNSSNVMYVKCPDGVSACGDNQICCRKGSGYTCCPGSLSCCQEGLYCCSGVFLKEIKNQFSTLSFMVMDEDINSNSKNDIQKSIPFVEQNISMLIDSFLQSTGFYNLTKNTEICRNEISESFDKFLNENKIDTSAEGVLETLFEVVNKFFTKCEIATEELIQKIKTYDFKNFLINLIERVENQSQLPMDLLNVMLDFNEIKTQWQEKNYAECGKSLGKLFNFLQEKTSKMDMK